MGSEPICQLLGTRMIQPVPDKTGNPEVAANKPWIGRWGTLETVKELRFLRFNVIRIAGDA